MNVLLPVSLNTAVLLHFLKNKNISIKDSFYVFLSLLWLQPRGFVFSSFCGIIFAWEMKNFGFSQVGCEILFLAILVLFMLAFVLCY